MAGDDKVVIGQTHAADDAEAVLIGYLLGVEALRAGKQALMWLTKDGIQLATKGYSDEIVVPGAPSIKDLHAEYIDKGGRFFACPAEGVGRLADLHVDEPDLFEHLLPARTGQPSGNSTGP